MKLIVIPAWDWPESSTWGAILGHWIAHNPVRNDGSSILSRKTFITRHELRACLSFPIKESG